MIAISKAPILSQSYINPFTTRCKYFAIRREHPLQTTIYRMKVYQLLVDKFTIHFALTQPFLNGILYRLLTVIFYDLNRICRFIYGMHRSGQNCAIFGGVSFGGIYSKFLLKSYFSFAKAIVPILLRPNHLLISLPQPDWIIYLVPLPPP